MAAKPRRPVSHTFYGTAIAIALLLAVVGDHTAQVLGDLIRDGEEVRRAHEAASWPLPGLVASASLVTKSLSPSRVHEMAEHVDESADEGQADAENQ